MSDHGGFHSFAHSGVIASCESDCVSQQKIMIVLVSMLHECIGHVVSSEGSSVVIETMKMPNSSENLSSKNKIM